jgi:transcriptional regulator with XRE-family HTH domain
VKRDNPKKKSEAKEFHIQVGKRLQRYRLEAGVTQQALGIRIGRTANTIAEYEAGRTKIPIEVVAKLAKELNFSIDELLFGEHGRMEFVVENQLRKISSKRILLYMKLLAIELERRDIKS